MATTASASASSTASSGKHYTCLVAGATGAVGLAAVRELCRSPACARVTVLTRRPFDKRAVDGDVVEQQQQGGGGNGGGGDATTTTATTASTTTAAAAEKIDALELHDWSELPTYTPPPSPSSRPASVDAAVCALGTTMRAAGSKAAFRTVDYNYVVEFARLAVRLGAKHIVLVSSSGASSASWFTYMRTKGEAENAVAQLCKQNGVRLSVMRPGLLLTPPREGVARAGEAFAQRMAKSISPLRAGGRMAVWVEEVARAARFALEEEAEAAEASSSGAASSSSSSSSLVKRLGRIADWARVYSSRDIHLVAAAAPPGQQQQQRR